MSTNSVNLEMPVVPQNIKSSFTLSSSLIFIFPMVVAIALTLLRFKNIVPNILKEGNLTVVALIAYLSATVVFITYFLGREKLLLRIGIFIMGLGFVMNFSGWGIRWIEIVEHFKQQPAIGTIWNSYSWVEKISHTYPLTGLYDVGLGFTSIAVFTSLIIASRKKYDFIGFITMPMASLVLILVVFLGNEITTLQPILRSYWRPIHVSLAAISYGVCLVSFGVAVLYLLKDKVKIESMALSVVLLTIATYSIIGDFKVLTHGTYGIGVRAMGSGLSLVGGGVLRADLPGVGFLMQIETIMCIAAAICLALYTFQNKKNMQVWGNRLVMLALILQVGIFSTIYYQMKYMAGTVVTHINQSQFAPLGAWLIKNSQQDPHQYNANELSTFGQQFLKEQSPSLSVSFSSNPIELAAIVTLIACLGFTVLFMLKGNSILASLPELSILDDLNYKVVSVCFPMLAMMLITGAVWANESWGSYWSWDPKETWALITWLAYAGYLHTRIVHGWRGRSSAYFAVIGFLFVIFTYLGVSFILPGLHSYAGVE